MTQDPEIDPNAPAITSSAFVCPRRSELGIDPAIHNVPPEDSWGSGPGMSDLGPHCSWCGSLNPDTFMDSLASGGQLIPTDKNYKAYVRFDGKEDKFYYQHLSDEQKQKLIEMANAKEIQFGVPGYWYVVPFFAVLQT